MRAGRAGGDFFDNSYNSDNSYKFYKVSEKKILSRGNVVELCTAVAKSMREKCDKPRALYDMLPIFGVCDSRAAMPDYGVWAFPDETQGGVWTIDGDFDCFGLGLTRKDYCSSSGIGGNAMVPREECVYRSMPGVILNDDDDGSVRLYVVDCMEKYALRELVRDVDVPKTHEIELRGSFFDAESLIFPTLLDWSMEDLDRNINVGDRVRLKCDFLQAQDGFPAGMWCEWVVTGKYYQTEGNTDVLLTGLIPSVDSIYKIDIYFDTNAKYPQVNNTVHVVLSLLLEW